MLYHARKLRSLVSIDAEYAARRALCAVLPMSRPQTGALFHCCVHKTASQWVRLVVSDPRFCMATGLKPRFAPSMRLNFPEERKPVPDGSVVGSFFTDADTLLAIDKPDDWRAFFVSRDPRDLLISRYYSLRYSHREAGDLRSHREAIADLSDEDGVLWMIENRFEDAAERLRSFAACDDERVVLAKYEDLTGPDRLSHWMEMLSRLDMDVPRETLGKILDFYRLDRMRAPQSVGRKDEKYRHGKRGEWRDRFTPAIRNAFENRFGGITAALGYE